MRDFFNLGLHDEIYLIIEPDMDMISPSTPMITDEQLLAVVEDFLQRSDMRPTRFGIEAMREGGLVNSLREGRSLSLKNANKVLDFIAEWDANNRASTPPSASNASEITSEAEGESTPPFASAPGDATPALPGCPSSDSPSTCSTHAPSANSPSQACSTGQARTADAA